MRRLHPLPAVWLLALALPCPVYAIQQRQVEFLTPRGGTRGTTVEVLLQGMDLADPREILFYRGGIEAVGFETLPPLKEPLNVSHGGKVVERVKVRFKIAADCPLGEHPLRLRTGTTLGTLCTFWVSPFPTVDERETDVGQNDTPGRAEAVALNSTVAGKIHPGHGLDLDLYRVELKAGQGLGVEVDSLRLSMMAYGDSGYDLMVRVLDGEGRELARNDDNGLHVQDPLLSFKAPHDGPYLVEVRQRVFRHNPFGFYRLHVGTFTRPLAVYPAGGPAGSALNVRFLGDAAGETAQTVALPGRPGPFEVFPGPEGMRPPSPLTLRVSPYPNVLESDAKPEGPTPAPAVPVALNGVIESPGDTDEFRLPLKKGAAYRVRVYARSLGTPLDPKIWLRPAGAAAGANELSADDSALRDRDIFALSNDTRPKDMLDPSVVFTPKEDGDYLLGIGDTREAGGPTSVYRVEVEPVSDSVFTYVVSTANDAFEVNRVTGFIVPQGNRWTLNVSLGEGQGNRDQGDLELEPVGLPAGVKMTAPRVTKGLKTVPVQFEADRSAAEGSALIEIAARPVGTVVSPAGGSQQGVPFVNHSGGHAWHYVTLDKFALAVTRPAPFHVDLVAPRVALVRSGELTLTVKLTRHGGFDEAVDVQPDWLPPGVAGESAVTISPGQTEAKYTLHADPNAQPGAYKVAMNATTTGGLYYSGVGRVRVSSAFADLTVSQPYVAVEVRRTAVERGRRGEIVCDVKALKPFPGRASAVLRRLPGGVSLREPLPTFTAGDTRLTFSIEATPDALVGQYPGVVCEVTLEENGQSVRQQTGSGVLRVDPARSRPDASP